MKLTFAGSGDAFGSGGRFNTCFYVEAAPQTFLIDCGASSMVALNACGLDIPAIRTIFISHLHGDHFGALPFFMLDAQFIHRRTEPLTIAGPPGMADRLTQAQEVFFTGSSGIDWRFEMDVVELAAEEEREVHGVTVKPFLVDHFSGAPSYALRFSCDDKVVTYSGDTQWVDELVPAAADADLFICECYGYEGKTPLHIDYGTLRDKHHLFTAKRMIVTHMGPDMLDNLDAVEFEAAHDGMVVEI